MSDLIEKLKIGELYKVNRSVGFCVYFNEDDPPQSNIIVPYQATVLLLDVKVHDSSFIKMSVLYNGLVCHRITQFYFADFFEKERYDDQ